MKRLILMMVACVMYACHLQAQTVTIDASNYETYLERIPSETNPETFTTNFRVKDHVNLRNAKTLVFSKTIPSAYRTFYYSDADNQYEGHPEKTVLANLEELVLEEGHYITGLRIHGTMIKKVTINNTHSSRTFAQLNIQSASLKKEDIILGDNIKFTMVVLHRNLINSLDPIYSMLSPTLSSFQVNGGKYNRKRYAGVDEGVMINPTNVIREIDMTRFPETVTNLQIRHNLLERLENVNFPATNLTAFTIYNNLLWSADLSSIVSVNGQISPQKPVADLTVVKGAAPNGSQDEVRLYLPEGQSELFDNSRLVPNSVKLLGNAVATQAILGSATQKYFKVASVADGTEADLALYEYNDGFSYQYNTRPALTDEEITSAGKEKIEVRDMQVDIKTYPYIMYVNPATKSGKDVNYYSGTLWLDYDAIVPEGTTVWIVTDINKDSVTTGGTAQAASQLNLEKIGDPGDLIPAGTAMYVRSDNKAGLYAFHKVWTHEILGWDGETPVAEKTDTLWYNKVYTPEQEAKLAAQRTKIGNRNLLEGYRTATTFDNKYEALILGIESKKGTKMIGFWPFNGTVIPAHRAFISEDTYRRITGDANAKGATFFFNDPETTGIKTVDNEQKTISREGWYTLDGRRLTGKPTQKGIYINNGRKEVVR